MFRPNDKYIFAHHMSYLDTAFDQQELMRRLESQLGPHLDRFDLIVGTGTSGLLAVPLAAYAFGKRFAIVRKESERCHSEYMVEGRMAIGDRWLFLDDLIGSGKTFVTVERAMRETSAEMGLEMKLVGVCLYNGPVTRWAADSPDLWFFARPVDGDAPADALSEEAREAAQNAAEGHPSPEGDSAVTDFADVRKLH